MKQPTEFNLNDAVAQWREALCQSSELRGCDLDELESHLRDSVATLEARGLSTGEAFLLGTRRVGNTGDLGAEFAKLNPGLAWRSRAFWAMLGILAYLAVGGLARVFSDAVIVAGGHFNTGGLALGWLATACRLVVILLALAWGPGSDRPAPRLAPRAAGPTLTKPRCRPRHPRPADCGFEDRPHNLLVAVQVSQLSATALGQAYIVGAWIDQLAPIAILSILLIACLRLRPRAELASGRPWLLLLVVAAVAGLAPGCGKKAEPVTSGPPAAEARGQTALEQSMALWTAGKSDESVTKFMSVDWSARPLFSSGAILNYSEAQFMALPQGTRDKINQQLIDDLGVLKALGTHVADMGKAALAQGDKAQAEKYFALLQSCGEALDQPDRTLLAQLVGRALKNRAASERSGAKN